MSVSKYDEQIIDRILNELTILGNALIKESLIEIKDFRNKYPYEIKETMRVIEKYIIINKKE